MVELGPLFFILAFFLGASSGSFACAAASRTAAGEKWWGLERSRCDCCGTALAPRDLVPVLSFLALRGRCRFCGARIPRSCLAAELACGALCAMFLWRFGASYSFIFSSASLHFLAIKGLNNYGYKEEASRIASKYVDMVVRNFESTHNLWEKYNVVEGNINVSNEYDMPTMMGWTAGTYISALNYLKQSER